MTTIRLKRLAGTQQFVSMLPHCTACSGCTSQNLAITLPTAAETVDASLSVMDQQGLLWNSLVKPIIFLVFTVMVCDLLELTELNTMLFSMGGFMLGLKGCKAMPETSLKLIFDREKFLC